MAMQAGLPSPDYGFAGRANRARRQIYLRAVVEGYRQDYGLLTDFLVEALVRGLAAARE